MRRSRYRWVAMLGGPAIFVCLAVAPLIADSNGDTTTYRSMGLSNEEPHWYTQAHSIHCNDDSDCLDVGSLLTGKALFTYSGTFTDYEGCNGAEPCSYLWIWDSPLPQNCPPEVEEEFGYMNTKLTNSNQSHDEHGGLDPPGSLAWQCEDGGGPV